MKIILFIGVFLLGVASYALIDGYLSRTATVSTVAEDVATTTTEISTSTQTIEPVQEEEPVVITDDGAQLDAPRTLLSADGTATDSTVRIIRSPEETLIAFSDDDIEYPRGTHIYLAEDMMGNEHFDVAPANVHEGVLVYGLPLDIDLERLTHLVLYDTFSETTIFYAKLR